MSWGIADTAPDIEKIKAESADYLNGLNSCGIIDYSTYCNAFDFYADLLDTAYEQGQKDAERKTGKWKPKIYRAIDGTLMQKQDKWYGYFYVCDQCGFEMLGTDNYCPNCGCKMESEE